MFITNLPYISGLLAVLPQLPVCGCSLFIQGALGRFLLKAKSYSAHGWMHCGKSSVGIGDMGAQGGEAICDN